MTVFQLNEVQAMRWLRDSGRDPVNDNAEEIIKFIGKDRVMGQYVPRLGDEKILFRTDAYSVGVVWLHPFEWVVFGPRPEPFTMNDYAFRGLMVNGSRPPHPAD